MSHIITMTFWESMQDFQLSEIIKYHAIFQPCDDLSLRSVNTKVRSILRTFKQMDWFFIPFVPNSNSSIFWSWKHSVVQVRIIDVWKFSLVNLISVMIEVSYNFKRVNINQREWEISIASYKVILSHFTHWHM